MKISLIDGFVEPIVSIREWLHHESDSETVNFLINAMLHGWKAPEEDCPQVDCEDGEVLEVEIRREFAQMIQELATARGEQPIFVAAEVISDAITSFLVPEEEEGEEERERGEFLKEFSRGTVVRNVVTGELGTVEITGIITNPAGEDTISVRYPSGVKFSLPNQLVLQNSDAT